jgi:hypothetical protein
MGAAPLSSSAPSAASEPLFTPAPPVPVQQVSPVSGAGQAKPVAATASASARPQVSLPGAMQPPANSPAAAPSAAADGIPGDIQADLNAINASATALARDAGGASSASAGSRGASPPTADTPIPTAAPPFVPTP